jgi:hypothetical protein
VRFGCPASVSISWEFPVTGLESELTAFGAGWVACATSGFSSRLGNTSELADGNRGSFETRAASMTSWQLDTKVADVANPMEGFATSPPCGGMAWSEVAASTSVSISIAFSCGTALVPCVTVVVVGGAGTLEVAHTAMGSEDEVADGCGTGLVVGSPSGLWQIDSLGCCRARESVLFRCFGSVNGECRLFQFQGRLDLLFAVSCQ